MPGVPSGRGCDGCRAQKKKCDQAKPSCSRCTRLGLLCHGAGQQRYKFRHLDKPVAYCRNVPTVTSKADASPPTIVRYPQNKAAVLVSSFVSTIAPSTDVSYNLMWAYGVFLEDIPSRLGTNEALDAAVEAVVLAHSNLCSSRGVQPSFLVKYSRALERLRSTLDDPVKACSSETLCAVMLLLMCQDLAGTSENRWTGHSEGAAQILRARKNFSAENEFEKKLLLSLRGPVLFEGIYNSRIELNPQEWNQLVFSDLDEGSPESKLMRRLARIPEYMQRAKGRCSDQSDGPLLLNDVQCSYDTLTALVHESRARYVAIQERMDSTTSTPGPLRQAHFYLQRLYGLCLTATMLMSSVLTAISQQHEEFLRTELTNFARELVVLSDSATRYKPLTASSVTYYLCVAWLGAKDCSVRSCIEQRLAGHRLPRTHTGNEGSWASELQFRSEEVTRRCRPASTIASYQT